MIADMHVHSTFSPDGISTMEEQCIAALEKGERIICFTDHVDYNVAEKNNGIIKDNSKAIITILCPERYHVAPVGEFDTPPLA